MPIETNMYGMQPAVKFDPAGAISMANGMVQNKLLHGAVEQQATAIDAGKLELTMKQVGAFRSSLGTLLGNPNPTTGHITELGVTGVKQGWFSGAQFAAEAASWPGDNAPPEARREWVESHYVRQLSHENQIGQMLGQGSLVNDGDKQSVVYSSAMRGTRPSPGGTFTNELSPQDRIVGQGTYINGQPGTVPVGSRFDNRGNLRVNPLTGQSTEMPPLPSMRPLPPLAGAGAASNMAPRNLTMAPDPTGGRSGAPGTTGPGQVPGDPRAVPVPAPQAAAAGPAGFNPTGANIAAGGSVDLLNRDRNLAANYRADVTPLETAIPLLEKLGPNGTGPASEKLNDLKSLAITLGVPGANGWTDNVKAFDETRKYLLQSAMKGDVGTNDKLASAIAGNPSVHISNAAATDVAKASLALRMPPTSRTRRPARRAATPTVRPSGTPNRIRGPSRST